MSEKITKTNDKSRRQHHHVQTIKLEGMDEEDDGLAELPNKHGNEDHMKKLKNNL